MTDEATWPPRRRSIRLDALLRRIAKVSALERAVRAEADRLMTLAVEEGASDSEIAAAAMLAETTARSRVARRKR